MFIKAKKGGEDCNLLFGKTPKQFGEAKLHITW
jgi:hypothetical protein